MPLHLAHQPSCHFTHCASRLVTDLEDLGIEHGYARSFCLKLSRKLRRCPGWKPGQNSRSSWVFLVYVAVSRVGLRGFSPNGIYLERSPVLTALSEISFTRSWQAAACVLGSPRSSSSRKLSDDLVHH